MTKKKALEMMERVRESDNGEYVGRFYRYHVTPCFRNGFYIGEKLTRCDMNGLNYEIIYIDVVCCVPL